MILMAKIKSDYLLLYTTQSIEIGYPQKTQENLLLAYWNNIIDTAGYCNEIVMKNTS